MPRSVKYDTQLSVIPTTTGSPYSISDSGEPSLNSQGDGYPIWCKVKDAPTEIELGTPTGETAQIMIEVWTPFDEALWADIRKPGTTVVYEGFTCEVFRFHLSPSGGRSIEVRFRARYTTKDQDESKR